MSRGYEFWIVEGEPSSDYSTTLACSCSVRSYFLTLKSLLAFTYSINSFLFKAEKTGEQQYLCDGTGKQWMMMALKSQGLCLLINDIHRTELKD